jgi:hypothetical protein
MDLAESICRAIQQNFRAFKRTQPAAAALMLARRGECSPADMQRKEVERVSLGAGAAIAENRDVPLAGGTGSGGPRALCSADQSSDNQIDLMLIRNQAK